MSHAAAYLPNTQADVELMLQRLGLDSLEALFASVPASVRLQRPLQVPGPLSEIELLRHCAGLARQNANPDDWVCFQGGGVADHFVPAVVRYVLSRGEFLTAYTAYQPEASQGFLQAMYEFQTMIARLTGMEVANASLYDGATALAEAVFMALAAKGEGGAVYLSKGVNPRYRRVLRTLLRHRVPLLELPLEQTTGQTAFPDTPVRKATAICLQHPNYLGCLEDLAALRRHCDRTGALMVVAVDPISMGMLKPPGDFGADVVVAEGQPLGLPLSFGGPLVGLLTTRRSLVRLLPGRLVGRTRDAAGRQAFTLTLQTREQHIRRERATSNICTNQAMCALAVTVYLTVLGETGLRQVAHQCLQKSHYAFERLVAEGKCAPLFPKTPFFKEFTLRPHCSAIRVQRAAARRRILSGIAQDNDYPEFGSAITFCVTEKRTAAEIDALVEAVREAEAGG